MSRKNKIGIKHVALFVTAVVAAVFLINFTVGYLKGIFGSVSPEDAAEFLSG